MPPRKKETPIPPRNETIIQQPMEEVMHTSMMPYSEYVILERALPRVEDGLKPVQRRILYTMQELSLSPDKPHRKCARIVGDCLGKYHPHGDTSVYDALVRMAQPFAMRGMLVDGHGNFGSIDGDSAAAMRYTEARLTPLSMELLRDIEKDTVNFSLNFDDTQKEPDMLPGRFPNLLVNGASGIAVGLATNIPPHNLKEVVGSVIAQIDKPGITLNELMQHVKGPDFPTGGLLLDSDEMEKAYATGRGKLLVRAKVDIEEGSNGRKLLVITEMPYQVAKAALLEKILRLSEEKKGILSGIYDIRDESDRTGMRAVIELKRDVDAKKVLAYLYKYSDLQVTFGINMVAIADGKPIQMGLKQINEYYIRHQKQVVTRRTKYDLEQAKAREHILNGLMIAVDNLDEVIRIIRASKNPKEAKSSLMERFKLSELQAQAILDMRLQRLTGLEILALRKEYQEVLAIIAKLEAILKSDKKLLAVIKSELNELCEKYQDERRTQIISDDSSEDAIHEEAPKPDETIIIKTSTGFFKRMSPKVFEKVLADDNDTAQYQFNTLTDSRLLCFTNKGNVFPLTASQIPECKPKDRGLSIVGLLAGLEDDESIVSLHCIDSGDEEGELIFFTKCGMVKRTKLSEYNVRKQKYAALTLKKDDSLMNVQRLSDNEGLLLTTQNAMAIHFMLSEVSQTGRTTAGVKAIALEAGDEVLFATQISSEGEIVLVSDRGYMKRSLLVDFDPQARGGKGLKCFTFNKNGANGSKLIACLKVLQPFDFIVKQKSSPQTKLNTEQIAIEPRAGKGKPYVVAMMDDVITEVVTLPTGK